MEDDLMENLFFTEKQNAILNGKMPEVNPILVTSGTASGKKIQKNAWTSNLTKESQITEKALEKNKKEKFINVNRREEDVEEITEIQLAEKFSDEIFEISEIQLEERRENDENNEKLAEVNLDPKRNSSTWEGDDIKIYRDINARQKKDAEANEEFYKNNPGLTKGGKGTVGG